MNGKALLQDGSILLLVIVAFVALSIIVRTLRNDVPPMPSSRRVRATIIELLRHLPLPRQGTVVELGSGWGGLSRALSRALPAATVIGYENSPVPFFFSVVARRLCPVNNLRYEHMDFHEVSLREADLVTCYLSPGAMARLQPKLAAELRATAVVVSSTFALPTWPAEQVAVAGDMYRTRVYVYLAGGSRTHSATRHIDIVT